MLAGVSGGLARYFDIHPAFYRVGFVVLTLIGFKTAMQFIRSENLSALMQFGFSEFTLFIVTEKFIFFGSP